MNSDLIGLAFAAGTVAAFNPCGFAMLPAYLTLVIQREGGSQLAAPKTTRLLYSPSHEGPWATIATDLDNQGEYRWQPDRATPARVYLRIEVADAAGNVGAVTSPEPVTVSNTRVIGRLGGVRTLPTTP